jgi:hypothetical protein
VDDLLLLLLLRLLLMLPPPCCCCSWLLFPVLLTQCLRGCAGRRGCAWHTLTAPFSLVDGLHACERAGLKRVVLVRPTLATVCLTQAMGKRSRLSRETDRDVSERIALGLPTGNAQKQVQYDSRLFNQSKGMDSGFGKEVRWRSAGWLAGYGELVLLGLRW